MLSKDVFFIAIDLNLLCAVVASTGQQSWLEAHLLQSLRKIKKVPYGIFLVQLTSYFYLRSVTVNDHYLDYS